MAEKEKEGGGFLGTASPTGTEEEQLAQQDFVVLRLIAVGLAMVALVTAVGIMVLAGLDQDMPEGALALGSTAVGALATMMTARRWRP